MKMGMEPRLIPRHWPQNPMGADDQIWSLPSTPPAQSGTMLGKRIIAKIRTVALRKTTQDYVDRGAVLRFWRSSCRRKLWVVPSN